MTALAANEGYIPHVPPANQSLSQPPPGVAVNSGHPDSNSYHVYICAAICIPLILILASLRLYNTMRIIHARGTLDDYVFMLSTACTIAYISLVIAFLSQGLFGRHVWDLTLGDLKNTPFLLVLLLETIWGPLVWLVKLSLFLLYLRLFGTLTWMKRLVWLGIIFTGLFYLAISIAKLGMCAPRRHESYIMSFSTERCARTKQLGVVNGVFNIISDAYLFVLPIPAVLKLHTDHRRKCGLLAVFMTGMA
ncbi:MAG: hypothetical protein Q9170_005019 [Blastenia crenularia]